MSSFGTIMTLTAQAASDLRNCQYHAMRLTGADTVNISSHAAGAPATLFGVLQNKPNSGQSAAIAYMGESKAVAGAAITAGVWLTTNGSGRLITAASGDNVIGQALETCTADGDVFRALIGPPRPVSHV